MDAASVGNGEDAARLVCVTARLLFGGLRARTDGPLLHQFSQHPPSEETPREVRPLTVKFTIARVTLLRVRGPHAWRLAGSCPPAAWSRHAFGTISRSNAAKSVPSRRSAKKAAVFIVASFSATTVSGRIDLC